MWPKERSSFFLVKLIIALLGNSEFISLDLHEKAKVILSIRLYIESYVNTLNKTRQKILQPQQIKRFRWQKNRFHSGRSVWIREKILKFRENKKIFFLIDKIFNRILNPFFILNFRNVQHSVHFYQMTQNPNFMRWIFFK